MEVQRNNKRKPKYSWLEKTSGVPLYKNSEGYCLNDCICHRKRGLVRCSNCHKSFMGRIGTRCPAHPEIAYLMDARNCAFCGAAAEYLQMDQI
ncbi:uncharacterized protein CG13380-like [Drosophila innubila]|uniref:uncharacterized protein CG13380-like n=1 Tax=Drosophila innubila TaxID=198719 RepID=UPI00148CF073|nr:uncharacterized protein CG13380-like [Drosophila innubila]